MAFGKYAVGYEQRVDFDRLRMERLQGAKGQMERDGLGTLATWDAASTRYLTPITSPRPSGAAR
ncbi:MAG: hypothetical protein SWK76_09470 [Actinomycetota bacterium]|nr:hypothetical protein [Actinomycetota bacterium]